MLRATLIVSCDPEGTAALQEVQTQRQCPTADLRGERGEGEAALVVDLPARVGGGPGSLGNRCLALNYLDHQRRLTLGRPPFDVVVHRHTHRYLLYVA